MVRNRRGAFALRWGGVSRYDGKAFKTLTPEDGLAGDWVYAIQPDPDGTIWFGTLGGLSRYDSPCSPSALRASKDLAKGSDARVSGEGDKGGRG
ncbi:hypothetical protein HYR99_14435 [Candidatus Poribacteria bacterium]|nr:hypothetical protein [Candidatus Poribacteria bacterium]